LPLLRVELAPAVRVSAERTTTSERLLEQQLTKKGVKHARWLGYWAGARGHLDQIGFRLICVTDAKRFIARVQHLPASKPLGP
jgi:hypothetical protein